MPRTIQDVEALRDSLEKLQKYVKDTSSDRGFDNETVQDRFMLLVEEVGELAKSMRPMHGVTVADNSVVSEIEHELADVFLLTVSLANVLDINLACAVVSKERVNHKRTWS